MPQNTSRIDWRKTDGKTGAFSSGFFSFAKLSVCLDVVEVQHLDTVKCYDLQLEGMGDRARACDLLEYKCGTISMIAARMLRMLSGSRKLREPQPADSEMMRPKLGLMASLRGQKMCELFSGLLGFLICREIKRWEGDLMCDCLGACW